MKPVPFICIGAAHWDIIARTGHAMQPGCDVPGTITRQLGGVALNVALALTRLHQDVTILTALGTDQPGNDLIAAMQANGIDCTRITRTNGATDAYLAIESSGEVFGAVADCVALERAGAAVIAALVNLHGTVIADCNLPESVLAALPRDTIFVAASPAKAPRLRAALKSGGILCANRREAEAICDAAFPSAASAAEAIIALGAKSATITDGPRSVACHDGTNLFTATPPSLRPTSATGAGDAFLAAQLVALSHGLDPQSALNQAVQAAANRIARPL